jgi:Peptidase family S41
MNTTIQLKKWGPILDNWTKSAVKTRTSQQTDPIEGLWKAGDYYMGIVKDVTKPNTFIGGFVESDYKLTLSIEKIGNQYVTTLFHPGFTKQETKIRLIKGNSILLLQNTGIVTWVRADTEMSTDNDEQLIIQYGLGTHPVFKKLNDSTNYFRMGSMDFSEKAMTDSLIKTHWQSLTTTPNLIIDIRSNPGGSDYTYQKILPLLYTQPTIGAGVYFSITPEIVAAEKDYLMQQSTYFDKKWLEDALINVEKTAKLVGQTFNIKPTIDSFSLSDKVYNYPKKVAVIFNNGSASSAETFIQRARQHKKVVTFGENSSGTLDYGNVRTFKFPCAKPYFSWSMPTTGYIYFDNKKVDNIGIEPQVKIPNDVENWVAYVLKRL